MSYDWKAALVFLGALILMTAVGRFVAFRIPALRRMRELNREADRGKLARNRFREAVNASNRAGLITNAVFYVTILPFCVSLAPRPLWRHAASQGAHVGQGLRRYADYAKRAPLGSALSMLRCRVA